MSVRYTSKILMKSGRKYQNLIPHKYFLVAYKGTYVAWKPTTAVDTDSTNCKFYNNYNEINSASGIAYMPVVDVASKKFKK